MKFIVLGNLTVDQSEITTIQLNGSELLVGLKDKSYRTASFQNVTEAKKAFDEANTILATPNKASAKSI